MDISGRFMAISGFIRINRPAFRGREMQPAATLQNGLAKGLTNSALWQSLPSALECENSLLPLLFRMCVQSRTTVAIVLKTFRL